MRVFLWVGGVLLFFVRLEYFCYFRFIIEVIRLVGFNLYWKEVNSRFWILFGLLLVWLFLVFVLVFYLI